MSAESLKCKGVVGCENRARRNETREGSQFAEKIGGESLLTGPTERWGVRVVPFSFLLGRLLLFLF